jgi:hypothetical protein
LVLLAYSTYGMEYAGLLACIHIVFIRVSSTNQFID